jgi:tetratricopeptide (TPR) repeat protein
VQQKRTASGDVSFEIPALEIKGVVYEPEALGRPGMPLVQAKRKTTIDKQRSLVQTTKDPVQKQAQAAVLATMLYLESKTNKTQEKAMQGEARQVLRDVAQAAGDKEIDEITLRLLGSYELLLDDYPAAEKAWQSLIDKDPKAKDIDDNRAWLAYSQLKQFKNAAALASTAGEKPDDKQPELAYVMAWAKLRTGDHAGAWQALVAAARGWGQNGGHDDLVREALFFAGRANVPLDQAAAAITGVFAKVKQQQYELLAKLGLSGYALAGRWADGVAALDKAVELMGDGVPANDLPVIRYSQADFTVRLDAPEVAARFAKQALDALAACGTRCADKDKASMYSDVNLMGQLFHLLYATANDHRYYQPAHELYELTIPKLEPTRRTDAQQNLKKLETTLKNTKVGTGTHDKGAVGALLGRHNLEVQACYEAVLGTNPKLAGTITLNLESDATGGIKGLSLEPKPGTSELSAVTACVGERAKQWKLPKRGMPGSTRIKMSYVLATK